MLIIAKQTFTRQTPRKVRLVANAVKKLTVELALKQLAVIERRSTLVLLKVMKQAEKDWKAGKGSPLFKTGEEAVAWLEKQGL